MKVYFVDGQLDVVALMDFKNIILNSKFADYAAFVDGKDGLSECKRRLDLTWNNGTCVITNSALAFDGKYTWDNETEQHELYIYNRKRHCFKPVHELTDRQLRRGNNLFKLYLTGEFNSVE